MIPSYTVQKGRLEARDSSNKSVISIEFQYNPSQITRTLKPQYVANDPFHIIDIPEETLSFKIELDATDSIGPAKGEAEGIYPQLSRLEILLYPQSSKIKENSDLLNDGQIAVILSQEVPELFLVLGDKRVLPVQIQSITVTEIDYDCSFTPIRAEVSLSLRVFKYGELSPSQPMFDHLLAYHQFKEKMARGG